MARPCPSCLKGAYECSYPGEARAGCLLDKRKRDALDALDAKNKGLTTKELRDRIQARPREVAKKEG